MNFARSFKFFGKTVFFAAFLAAFSGCGESSEKTAPAADVPARRTTVPAEPVSATTPAAVPAVSAAPSGVPATEEKTELRVTWTQFDRANKEYDIVFSRPIYSEELAEHLTFTPAVEFRRVHTYSPTYFSVRADFEPGKTYTARVGKGLRAAGTDGMTLEEDFVDVFIAPDLLPQLEFLTRGTFFPLNAPDFELPLHLVNPQGKISVETREAYADCAAGFIASPQNSDFSKKVFEESFAPEARRNRSEAFSLELEKIGIARRPGMYLVRISDDGAPRYGYYGGASDTRFVVVTDLVLQAVRNGSELVLVLKNLSGNAPVPDAKISVFSRKNRLVSEVRTDASGFAKIALPELDDYEDYAVLLLAESGGDRTFLSLRGLASVRQNGGAGFAKFGTRAYVFPERGVCRPGEKIHVFAALRDGETLCAKGGVPAEFYVEDPKGNAFSRVPVVGDEFGFYKAEIPVPAFAATGSYRVELRIPGRVYRPFGVSSFSVAEYVPDTIELSLEALAKENETVIRGRAGYYFGAPLAAGTVRLTRSVGFVDFSPKSQEFAGFAFGAPMPESLAFTETARNAETDGNGVFEASFAAPVFDRAVTQPVVDLVEASVSGAQGGRLVSSRAYRKIHYADFYFGTREKSVSERERVFEILALSPEEKTVALDGKKFRAELSCTEWGYVLREAADGSAVCEWQRREIAEKEIAFDGSARELAVPVPRGGYWTLRVFDDAGTLLHEREFWHYYGETGTRSKNASLLSFSFDKEKYAPGETARITFESSVSGTAVLFFGSEKIEGMRQADVRFGKNVFELPVPADEKGGSRFFSLTASGNVGGEMQRLFGVGAVPVDQRSRRIFVKTTAPEVVRPGEKTTVGISLADADGNPVSGEVQLWAVDRGVLSLTGFATPDAFSHFFAPKACPYEFGDGYGDIYPRLKIDGKLIGGGAGALRKFLGEEDESKKSAVVMTDVLRVPASGETTAELVMPDFFDGGLRLMAVAVSGEKLGGGEANVIVRNPVSVKATAPRAAAFGDEFEILSEVFSTSLPEQDLSWRILRDGEEIFSGTEPAVKQGGKFVLRERVSAGTRSGASHFEITVSDASGEICGRENFVVSVRSPLVARDVVRAHRVEPGETREFPAAGAFGSLEIGSPALAVAGALKWLEEYPYGCLEQTAAGAFPLLATEPLVRAGVVPAEYRESAASKIRGAIARLASMRLADGSYSMWAGGRTTWLSGTLFAYHFLLEADAAGFPLDARSRDAVRLRLKSVLNRRSESVATRAYALFLLALSGDGRAEDFAGALLAERGGDDFSRFLIGAALVKTGRAADGMNVIAPLLGKHFWAARPNGSDCLDSDVRRAGFALRILSEIAPDDPATAKLALELCGEMKSDGHWGSTQKNAWAAFGLAKFFAFGGAGTERGTAEFGGEKKPLEGVLKIPGGNAVRLENTGTRPIFVFERSREIPEKAESESAGFEISREYLDAAGTPVTQCETGDLLTVKIRVRADARCESAVICDLLPGGLEIEDESLATRGRANAPKSAKSSAFREAARERRFDRFLAFGEFSGSSEFSEITYRVRAVSRGKFGIPPIQVESMYDGEQRAIRTPSPDASVFEVR